MNRERIKRGSNRRLRCLVAVLFASSAWLWGLPANAQTSGGGSGPLISNTIGLGPQVGFYRCNSVDEAAMYLGVLSRIRLGGIMALEGAAGYRGKQHFRLRSGTGEDFTAAVHSIPLTASLVLYVPLGPTFMPYVVGGLGAHYLILDYSEELNQQSIADKEKVRFGYHVGAGLEIPRAQSKGFGAGVIIGEPTGLNGKGWISQHSAVVGGVGWRLGVGKDRLQLHADYLWHFHEWIRSSQQFSPYVGVGGRLMSIDGDGVFGVRIPFGIVWIPEDAPLDVFLEVVPVVDLAPATDLNGNGGVGIRFFFQ